jgi:uncharacterized membrane protein YeaQ/YmgE (transglycosylase-associated protein family)
MGVFSWIIFGLISGVIAKSLHSGKEPGGWIATIVVGILGGVVGGWIGTFIGWGKITEWSLKNFGLAVLGSIVVLWLYNKIKS